jgi:hypothetical protein
MAATSNGAALESPLVEPSRALELWLAFPTTWIESFQSRDITPTIVMMTSTHFIRRLLLHLLRGLAVLVLVIFSCWLSAYFAMGSSTGRAHLLDLVHRDSPSSLAIGSIHWGPHPGELTLGAIDLSSENRRLAHLGSARVELTIPQLFDLIGGREIALDRVSLALSTLHATVADDGSIDLVKALVPPKPPGTEPPRMTKRFRIEAFDLRCDHLALDTPEGALDLRDLQLDGSFDLALLPRLTLSLRTGTGHVSTPGRPVLGFDSLTLGDLSLTGTRLSALVRLSRDRQTVISSHVVADLLAKRFEFDLSLDLRPLEVDGPLRGLPRGLVLSDAALRWEDGQLSGAIAHLGASALETSFGAVFDFSVSIPRIDFEPGRLLPRVALDISNLSASHLEAWDHVFSHLHLPEGHLAFDKRALGQFGPGLAVDWSFQGTSLGPARIAIDTDIGLTGGNVRARLETSGGLVDATGTVKVSLLRRRTDFDLALSLDAAERSLLIALLPDLASSELPLEGSFRALASLELEPGTAELVTWQKATIEAADGSSRHWENDTWTTPPAEASSPPKEVSP